jgi:hypothetical protein
VFTLLEITFSLHSLASLALFTAVTILSMLVTSITTSTLAQHIAKSIAIEATEYSGIEGEEIAIPLEIRSIEALRFFRIPSILLDADPGIELVSHRLRNNGDRCELLLVLRGFVGTHSVKGVVLLLREVFGLLNIFIEMSFEKDIRVCVVPLKIAARFSIETLLSREMLYESALTRRKGMGVDILGVREYVPGDDFRRIAWKATAKAQRLMVKEYEGRSFRNVVAVIALHNGHFAGSPPPIQHISRAIVDLVSKALARGMNVRVGVVTEDDIGMTSTISKGNVYEVHKIFTIVTWPKNPTVFHSYSSSNRIVRWFTKHIVSETCKEPCIVALFIDPQDDFDVESIERLYRDLKAQRHDLRVFLTPSASITFLCSEKISEHLISVIQREKSKMAQVMRLHTSIDKTVYTPTDYLLC